jgi:hypothetical protein
MIVLSNLEKISVSVFAQIVLCRQTDMMNLMVTFKNFFEDIPKKIRNFKRNIQFVRVSDDSH